MFKFKEKLFDILIIVPIMVAIILIPIILKYNTFITSSSRIFYNDNIDIVSWPKAVSLIILASIMLVLFFLNIYTKKVKINILNQKFIYLFILYSMFIIISTIFSKHKDIAIWGLFTRNEGMIVLLSYIIISIYSFTFINSKEQLTLVVYSMYIMILLLSIIAVSQFFNMDILKSNFIQSIIFPDRIIGKLNPNRNIKSLTFGNINYVGGFGSFIFSIVLSLYLLSDQIKFKILNGFFAIMSFFILLMSYSRTGYAAVFFTIFLIILVLNKYLIHKWKSISILATLLYLVYIATNKNLDNFILARLISTKNEVINSLTPTKNETSSPFVASHSNFQRLSITNNADEIKIIINNNKLYIKREGGLNVFYNSLGAVLNYNLNEENQYYFLDDIYKDIRFIFDNYYLIIYIYGKDITFIYDINKYKVLMSSGVKADAIDASKVNYFDKKATMFSNRGYIWSRGIPLLKNKILKGSGSDTFIFEFPQTDFSGKISSGIYSSHLIVDKPHNLFLGIANNTGIISLVVYVLIFIYYVFLSIKSSILFCLNNKLIKISLVVLFGSVSYLVQGFANDSIISLSSLLWISLGIGFKSLFLVRLRTFIHN